MLEKEKGNINVQKLRAILLLEADFNGLNKIIYNSRVIPALEKRGDIPFEVIRGRRSQLSIHVALNKKLISDCSNQSKRFTVVVSADASNYYNNIAYSYPSISNQHYGL